MTIRFVWQQVQRWWALALVIFAVDWLTKQCIEASIAYGQTVFMQATTATKTRTEQILT